MIDISGGDPTSAGILVRALGIVDDLGRLYGDLLSSGALPEDCEVVRLMTELPQGPVDLGTALYSGLANAYGALVHIEFVFREAVPVAPVVLQALMRSALVGSARTLYILSPQDPGERASRARAALATDCESGCRAMTKFSTFTGLQAFAAPDELVEDLQTQRKKLWPAGRPPGDGKIVNSMARGIADALLLSGLAEDDEMAGLYDHWEWLWNVYSGSAHGYAWPRLVPGITESRAVPGDLGLDLHQIASAAQLAVIATLSRIQAGTAGTSEPIPGEWPIPAAS